MKRTCEGYCGGYVKFSNTRSVGGEQFCESCYGRYLRMLYHE